MVTYWSVNSSLETCFNLLAHSQIASIGYNNFVMVGNSQMFPWCTAGIIAMPYIQYSIFINFQRMTPPIADY
jgi:hypothetical protein